GFASRGHGNVDVFFGGLGHRGDHRFGVRRHDLDAPALSGIDPAIADVEAGRVGQLDLDLGEGCCHVDSNAGSAEGAAWVFAPAGRLRCPSMRSEAFSPIIMVGALVLPLTIVGMIEASAMRSPSMPCTRRSPST